MRKFSLFILISLFSLSICSNVFACTMSKEYEEWLKLPDEERTKIKAPVYCQELYMDRNETPTISEINKKVFSNPNYVKVMAGATDSSYLNPNQTPVKFQMSTGVCWAFTSIGMLEHLALKDNFGLLDFSEKHLVHMISNRLFTDYTNPDGLNVDFTSGGNVDVATNYYYRMAGPVYEDQIPFTNTTNAVSSNGYLNLHTDFLLDNYYKGSYDRNSCSTEQLRKFKELIYQYGSVGVSIRQEYSEPYFKDGKYLNYTGYDGENHAVILVGWDDNISKSNFNYATRNGAFIAKNSYSKSFGENGYIYISYDDVYVCSDFNVYDGISSNPYTKKYQTARAFGDGYGLPGEFNSTTNKYTLSTASKITVSSTEYLSRISFNAPANVRYNIYLSKNGYQSSTASTWKHLAYGDTTEGGVYTATFNDYEVSGTFHIIIDYESSSSFNYEFYCSPKDTLDPFYSGETPSTGINYIYYYNGWREMATLKDDKDSSYGCGANVTIYTSPTKVFAPADFNLEEPTGLIKKGDSDSQITIPYTLGVNFNTTFMPEFNIHAEGSNTSLNDKFTITHDATNKQFIIKLNDDTLSRGDYVIDVTYDNITKSKTFKVELNISFKTFNLKDDYIIIPIPSKLKVSYQEFIDDMILGPNLFYRVDNKEDQIVIDGYIQTKFKLVIDDEVTYTIIIQGDPNEDGNVGSQDYIRIRNHIMGTRTITDEVQKIAADANNSGGINSQDYIRIRNYIMAGTGG